MVQITRNFRHYISVIIWNQCFPCQWGKCKAWYAERPFIGTKWEICRSRGITSMTLWRCVRAGERGRERTPTAPLIDTRRATANMPRGMSIPLTTRLSSLPVGIRLSIIRSPSREPIGRSSRYSDTWPWFWSWYETFREQVAQGELAKGTAVVVVGLPKERRVVKQGDLKPSAGSTALRSSPSSLLYPYNLNRGAL